MPTRIYSGATPEQIAAQLAPLLELRREGMELAELERELSTRLLPHLMRYASPGFQSMFNDAPEPGALLGARLALEHNQGVTNWQVSPGGTVLEELCMRALCRLFGLAEQADATPQYCGTLANQQGVYMALHHFLAARGVDLSAQGLAGYAARTGADALTKLAVVTSADTHFSLRHAVRSVGLGERCLVSVPVDERRRMSAAQLDATLGRLRQQGREIVCVVGTTGTTSTGAVDPIGELASVCAEHGEPEGGVWLHVDGAYGLAYALVPEARPRFAGIERAHTLAWDPHKQMAVPIPNSMLFARDAKLFECMAVHSAYFNRADSPEPNPGLKSTPSTRPLSALPLLASILHQGLDGLEARLRAPLVTMQSLHAYLSEQDDMEPVHEPDTGVLSLRLRAAGASAAQLDALHSRIYSELLAKGERSISITRLDGRSALRLVSVSPQTDFDALMASIADIRRLAAEIRG